MGKIHDDITETAIELHDGITDFVLGMMGGTSSSDDDGDDDDDCHCHCECDD